MTTQFCMVQYLKDWDSEQVVMVIEDVLSSEVSLIRAMFIVLHTLCCQKVLIFPLPYENLVVSNLTVFRLCLQKKSTALVPLSDMTFFAVEDINFL